MTVECLIKGLMTFFSCLVFFLISLKFYRPKKEIFYLFIIFIICPTIYYCFVLLDGGFQQDIIELIVVIEIHYAISLAFIQTYPVLKIEIPTFKILSLLKNAKNTGLTKSNLKELMFEDELYINRLVDLKNDGFISQNGDIVSLKPSGKILAEIFIYYRRLLGFSTGRG